MQTQYLAQLTKKLAVITGMIGTSAFISVPAMADMHLTQNPTNSTESSPGSTPSGAGDMMNNPNVGNSQVNLVELASTNPQFSTLAKAVQAAGLEETLTKQGPYTVFAPTNEAFAALPDGALELLLQPENKDLLRQVLTYHVVPREVTSNQIATGSVNTLGGGVAVRVAENRVIVNNASVVQPDIQASNGVIHSVNRVLMPQKLREQLVSQLNTQAAQ